MMLSLVLLVFVVSPCFGVPYLSKPLYDQYFNNDHSRQFLVEKSNFESDNNSTVSIFANSSTDWISYTMVNPTLHGRYDNFSPWKVYVDGNYAYLVNRWCCLQILNITDLTNPVLLGKYYFPDLNDVFASGDYAYVLDLNGIVILDVSDKMKITKISHLYLDGISPYRITVKGNIAYLLDYGKASLHIMDITVKTNPVYVKSHSFGVKQIHDSGLAINFHLNGNFFYICRQEDNCYIVEITSPLNPVNRGVFGLTKAVAIFATNDHAYILDSASFLIYSISNPDTPIKQSNTTVTNGNSIYVLNTYAYVTRYQPEGLLNIYISNKTSPELKNENTNTIYGRSIDLISSNYIIVCGANYERLSGCNILYIDIPGSGETTVVGTVSGYQQAAQCVAILRNRYVYTGYYPSPIRIYDTIDPKNIIEVNMTNVGYTYDFVVVDDIYLYIASSAVGMHIYNCSIPTSPTLIGKSVPVASNRIKVYDGYAYLCQSNICEIFDLSNIHTGPMGAVGAISGFTSNDNVVGIDISGNFTFIVVKYDLYVYNTSLKNTPDLISKISITSDEIFLSDIVISGQYAYVSVGYYGIVVLDISNVNNIQIVSYSGSIGDGFRYLDVQRLILSEDERFAYTSIGQGLAILDLSEKTNIKVVSVTTTQGSGGLAMKNNIAYVADGESGIKIFTGDLSVYLKEETSENDDDNYVCGNVTVSVFAEDLTGSSIKEFVIYEKDSDVCNSHGICFGNTKCYCITGYGQSKPPNGVCDLWSCQGRMYNDPKVCSDGNGKCIDMNDCVCEDSFSGDNCDFWQCSGTDYRSPEVCSGNGVCYGVDDCRCKNGFVGDICKTNILLPAVLAPTLSVAGIGFFLCLCIVFGMICCCCCVGVVICICSVCCLGAVSFQQLLRLKKYGQLRDIDLLLREQKMEDDVSIAHLRFNKQLFEIKFEDIKTISILGEGGSQSVVFKANWKGKLCAFKCFKTRTLISTQDKFDEFEREVEILGSLSHPNIIRFFGACMNPPRVGILMEFCSKGELLEFVVNFRENTGIQYPTLEKIRLLIEIASALEFLHDKNVIHRDLKCENVLIDDSENAKLMDFGLSRLVDRMSVAKTKRIGTNVYMAPELINSENYDEKCDVFSYAIMAYILMTENNNPYGDVFQIEMKVANNPEKRPDADVLDEKIGEDFQWLSELIQKCWHHDAEERYSCGEIRKLMEEKGNMEIHQKKESEKIVDITPKNENRDDSEENERKKKDDEDDDVENEELKKKNEMLERQLENLRKENEELKDEIKSLKEEDD